MKTIYFHKSSFLFLPSSGFLIPYFRPLREQLMLYIQNSHCCSLSQIQFISNFYRLSQRGCWTVISSTCWSLLIQEPFPKSPPERISPKISVPWVPLAIRPPLPTMKQSFMFSSSSQASVDGCGAILKALLDLQSWYLRLCLWNLA